MGNLPIKLLGYINEHYRKKKFFFPDQIPQLSHVIQPLLTWRNGCTWRPTRRTRRRCLRRPRSADGRFPGNTAATTTPGRRRHRPAIRRLSVCRSRPTSATARIFCRAGATGLPGTPRAASVRRRSHHRRRPRATVLRDADVPPGPGRRCSVAAAGDSRSSFRHTRL